MLKSFNKLIGRKGEKEAKKYLLKNGYDIIDENYSSFFGEIDIIAKDKDGTIVFIEVKKRTNSGYGLGLEAVNNIKQKKIIKTAMNYISLKNLECLYRFDVISIDGERSEVTHVKNAFTI